MKLLTKEFYLRDEVVEIARELLGKLLLVGHGDTAVGGLITETEVYAGTTDKASHAWGGRRTLRTEVMYAEGGIAYVYLCYGIHSLFNVVTNKEGIPHAVLVRAVWPMINTGELERRRGMKCSDSGFSDGPGKLTKALGIGLSDNGCDLRLGRVRIYDRGVCFRDAEILTGPRIGVGYAGEDAILPYRFRIDMRSKSRFA